MKPITLSLELKGGFKFKKFIAGAHGTLVFSTAGTAPVNCYKRKMYIPIVGKGSSVSFFLWRGLSFQGGYIGPVFLFSPEDA